MPNFYAQYPIQGGGGGVTSIDGLTGAITLVAGAGITITDNSPGAGDITIAATGPGAAITSINGDTTAAQTLSVGTAGTDFAIVDAGSGSHVFNLPTASAVNRGALSSADWSTFNSKQPAGNYITALTGDGTATGPGSAVFTLTDTAVIPGSYTNASITVDSKGRLTAASSGTAPVTNVTATAPLSSSGGSTPNISMTQSDTSTDGWLSSTDWNTFNNKFDLPALTAGSVLFSDGTTIAQDNSNFFWDDTNKTLFLGNAAHTAEPFSLVAQRTDTDPFAQSGTSSQIHQTNTTANAFSLNSALFVEERAQVATGITQSGASAGVIFQANRNFGSADDGDIGFFIGAFGGANQLSTGTNANSDIIAGVLSQVNLQSGNATKAADFYGLQGDTSTSGTIGGLFGVYIEPPSAGIKDNWLSGQALIGGSTYSSHGETLKIVGDMSATTSVTDTGTAASIFSATSNTTIAGSSSNTTIGINGVAQGLVQAGAENDKTVAGMNFAITRGDSTDQGILDNMNGANVLMFINSDPAGVTNNAYGYSSLLFSESGTLTNLYDFYSMRVPAGPGVVTNHYGVYINADSTTPVQNWLGDHVQAGGTSFVAATNALEVAGVFGIRDVASGFQVSFAAPSLVASTPYILPAADGTSGYVLTTDGAGNLSWMAAGGGSGANTALSNLVTTAINQSLTPDTDNTYSIGNAGSLAWAQIASYIYYGGSGTNLIDMTAPNIQLITTAPAGELEVFNFLSLDLKGQGENADSTALRFYDNVVSPTNYMGFRAPDALTGVTDFILPDGDGSSGQVLSTDGAGNLSWVSITGATNQKELFVLSGTDITNQYIDLSHVALTDSINFVVQGQGSQIEGASYDYSVSYTGGAGGNTRITFLNGLATGGGSALIAGDVVVAQYEY